MPKFIEKKLILAFVLALLLMISVIPKTNVNAKANGAPTDMHLTDYEKDDTVEVHDENRDYIAKLKELFGDKVEIV